MSNLLDPAILFFFFGVLAALLKSNLEIPGSVAKFLSLYLLLAIGFKGGVAFAATGLTLPALLAIGLAVFLAVVIPSYSYPILRQKIGQFDAAAIAATYGSVSAVTFIVGSVHANRMGIDFGGYLAVALVLMETPAVFMAIVLAQRARRGPARDAKDSHLMSAVLREAFIDGAHLMLIGSLVVGALTGYSGMRVLEPAIGPLFKGVLLFFMLDMGLTVGKRLRDIQGVGLFLISFALFAPMVNAALALSLARLLNLPMGDAFMLAVLAASASYIVVPAVVRHAIPEANPSYYFSMALAVTFPFNIGMGIPLYFTIAQLWWK